MLKVVEDIIKEAEQAFEKKVKKIDRRSTDYEDQFQKRRGQLILRFATIVHFCKWAIASLEKY
jgi:hypothetical protein